MKLENNSMHILMSAFLLMSFVVILNSINAWAYTPPIGIPDPSWGTIHPIDTASPSMTKKCPGWPSTVSNGCYYIDPEDPNSIDTGNVNGTPNIPRKTLANAEYSAGTYIYIAGQVKTATSVARFNCSEANPCWITSSPKTTSSTGGGGISGLGRIAIQGNSHYLFIENLVVNNKPTGTNGNAISISNTPLVAGAVDHIVFRNNIIKDVEYTADAAVFSVSARDSETINNIVFYNNNFLNVGDPLDTEDNDLHSMGVGLRLGSQLTATCYNVWFLSNRCKDSTQCLQINGWTDGQPNLHHIYVGKNYGENERQRSFSTKQASHVIFSQNETVPGVNRASGGYSEGYGWSLGADYVWFIFNKSHGGVSCIRNSDSTGGTSSTSHVFIIGNICYDSQFTYPNQEINRMGQAVSLDKGGSTVHIVDNTFVNTIGMVKTEQSDLLLYIHGNIFYQINTDHSFLNFYSNTPVANLHINNNLYFDPDGNPRWNYTSSIYNNFSSFSADHPEWNLDSHYFDPLFVNESANTYAVGEGSIAIRANKNEKSVYGYPDVYALFESNYGINIRVDYNGNFRPSTGDWTLGAFEFAGESQGPIIQNIKGTNTLTP